VLKIIEDARTKGVGRNYLIQHSAGSGKSNTIAWTAHRLITLHDEADKSIFDTIIIVTDRVVLDRQLQGTVAQFEQTAGVVKKIDGTSRQLKDAIESNARIIITTIQKFSTEHLKAISGQGFHKFAILIDEAHGSQSGKSAQALSETLTREEATGSEDIEDLIAEYQRQRGPQLNISYLGFTATPRNVTLERFGTLGADGLPHPFHLYSMRQAIEEGFILDVLQNYMTYKAYYALEKAIEVDPKFVGTRAQRRVARFASLHPTALTQKVEVIVEHFRRHVLKELDGKAKAMIVTQSREHALRYYFALKSYIQDKGYTDMKALVAFSGDLTVFAGNRDIIEFVQRAVGYSLSGQIVEQCLFIMTGTGANGKSTFINAVREVFGDYGGTTPMQSLTVSHFSNGQTNDLAAMEGKRFVSASDGEAGQRLAESKIKNMTGGDRIACRAMYKDFREYDPQFKLWVATNDLPQVSGTEEAIWRRIRVIKFPVTISEQDRDPNLTADLAAEASGILNWALDGYAVWRTGGLKPPAEVTEATGSYRRENDVVGQFIEARCVENPNAKSSSRILYENYAAWCGESGQPAVPLVSFGKELKRKGFGPDKRRNGNGWIGIDLKPELKTG
jgi:P4 family phage/plasmid primase-like protien